MPGSMPTFGDYALGVASVAALAWITSLVIKRKEPGASITLGQSLDIIRANSEINARLVTTIEQQTRAISDLIYAVNRLVGRLEGGD